MHALEDYNNFNIAYCNRMIQEILDDDGTGSNNISMHTKSVWTMGIQETIHNKQAAQI